MFGFGSMFDDDVIHEPKTNSFVGFDSPIGNHPD